MFAGLIPRGRISGQSNGVFDTPEMCVYSTACIAGMFSQYAAVSEDPDGNRGAVGRRDMPRCRERARCWRVDRACRRSPPVDWERETGPVPTSTSCVPVIPVDPAVFPRLEKPALIAPAPRLGGGDCDRHGATVGRSRERDVVPSDQRQPLRSEPGVPGRVPVGGHSGRSPAPPAPALIVIVEAPAAPGLRESDVVAAGEHQPRSCSPWCLPKCSLLEETPDAQYCPGSAPY